MTSIEREILEKISRLDLEKQRQVLDFVRSIEEPEAKKTYSAREIMKLPPTERNRIVIASLERTANEDAEVFDAFGESDIDQIPTGARRLSGEGQSGI